MREEAIFSIRIGYHKLTPDRKWVLLKYIKAWVDKEIKKFSEKKS